MGMRKWERECSKAKPNKFI